MQIATDVTDTKEGISTTYLSPESIRWDERQRYAIGNCRHGSQGQELKHYVQTTACRVPMEV